MDNIHIELDTGRNHYSVGEPFNPRLRIANRGSEIISFPGFVFNGEELGFAPPSFVHLVGPAGEELTRAHLRTAAYFQDRPPIRVEAGRDEHMFLPIYLHFQMRQAGDYTFWLDLGDEAGLAHTSNRLSFSMEDVPSSVPPGSVELKVESPAQFRRGEPMEMTAVFTSHFAAPLTLLKPQQDSFYGWVNPAYVFTVTDEAGRVLPPPLRSGTMAIPDYPATARFSVAPGARERQRLRLPSFPGVKAGGKFQARLTYLVRSRAIGKAGAVLDRLMNWQPDVFTGLLESNTVSFEVV